MSYSSEQIMHYAMLIRLVTTPVMAALVNVRQEDGSMVREVCRTDNEDETWTCDCQNACHQVIVRYDLRI